MTKEVHNVLKDMGPLKAPILNDFQALFFHCYWSFVATDVHDVVLQVLKGGTLPEGLKTLSLC